jgi:DNA-binding FadR family transcriptional regulator
MKLEISVMLRDRSKTDLLSEFLQYLAAKTNGDDRLPPLNVLSQELGISIASLREQLEVARALGLVEVRPRTGIRRLPYNFRPAVMLSLAYAQSVDEDSFKRYSDFRSHIEAAYWYEAVSLLTAEDKNRLQELINRALEKIHGTPAQIPQQEHRELHLTIYSRLNNPFVLGALEAYWAMYEEVGLHRYTDMAYLERIWAYHQQIVDAIRTGNYKAGFDALIEHMNLLRDRARPMLRHHFE